MLALDSLVVDLMFQRDAALEQEQLFDALGGEEAAKALKLLDPDMQDPRFEMELSPSRPFRRRGERRLMIIDDSVAPMREDPRTDPIVPLDLSAERERLIAMCQALDVRLGRLAALGTWGEAVLVARSAVDLRAWALTSWVLDPMLDADGKRRANQLTRAEFEHKIITYEQRLEELDEEAILAGLHSARVERHGDFLVVDVLGEDGSWDVRASLAVEHELAAVERFSMLPGAPAAAVSENDAAAARGAGERPRSEPAAEAVEPAAEPAAAEPSGEPLTIAEIGDRVVLIFPPERFDLDVAAALGKRDYDAVLTRGDQLPGAVRDRIHRDGADFIAPLEFLSEVFVDGKPLSRPQFEASAQPLAQGGRSLEVHCPRFGPVVLVDLGARGRFISSAREHADRVSALLA